ncbi:MAG: helix-turn-helix transcriptional regulator [Selenomonadaceae bacterium]|nr:helix-turn-helix transcriptional regulator [Selenomonadaceae bacterium]
MELGERIKKARKELNLTQQEFADKLGTTQNNIARYESNRVNPSAAVITSICRTFHISEEWLKNGKGEMFVDTDNSALSELASEYNLSDKQKAVITAFLKLTDEQKNAIIEAINTAAAELETAPVPPEEKVPDKFDETKKPEGISDEDWNLLVMHHRAERAKKNTASA